MGVSAEAGEQEEVRGVRLRGLVAANRAELQQRQAEAVAAAAAGLSRPVGAGWATFAAVSSVLDLDTR